MAAMPNQGLLSVRPTLTRSRSNTTPTTPSNLSIETSALSPQETDRPKHARSKSFLPPIQHDQTRSNTLPTHSERPTESHRFPRLHLPGRSQPQNDDSRPLHKRHRFMQSDNQQYQRKNDSALNQHYAISSDSLYPSSRGAPIPSLMRMRSYRSYRGPNNTDEGNDATNQGNSRGRANSDPRSPTQPNDAAIQRSPFEVQLERGELMRHATYQNVTQEDLDKLEARLENARTELSARFATNLDNATALMQRLDHGHDNLRITTESLMDTLSSFSSLAQQTEKLSSNFDTETANLESSLKSRISKFNTEICKKRTDRVSKLEQRGKAVSTKAENLSRRLDNCRIIVKNWEARELQKRRAWKGVRNGILWSLLLIFIGILAGVLSWKAVQLSDGHGTPEQVLGKLIKNESWTAESLASANIPEDVRLILQDIAAREKEGRKPESILRGGGRPKPATATDDRRVRLLDEL